MERNLYIGAGVLGMLAWLCSLLLSRAVKRSDKVSGMGENLGTVGDSGQEAVDAWYEPIGFNFRVAAFVLPVLVLLVTLPSAAPFSAGQGLGRGFFLGAVASLLSLAGLGGFRKQETGARTEARKEGKKEARKEGEPSAALAVPFALPIVAIAIPLICMRDVVIDALLGIAMGQLTIGALGIAGIRSHSGRDKSGLISSAMLAGTLFCVTLCGIEALGEMGGNVRFGNSLLPGPWSAPLLVLAAVLPALLLLAMSVVQYFVFAVFKPLIILMGAQGIRTDRFLVWLLGGGLLLLIGKVLDSKLSDSIDMFRLLAIGLGASGLAWWAIAMRTERTKNPTLFEAVPPIALPLLLIMVACMVAFQMHAGIGVAVVAMGVWYTCGVMLVCSLHTVDDDRLPNDLLSVVRSDKALSDTLVRVASFVPLFLLYRLFQVKYSGDVRNVVLLDHYALLGVGVGALLPIAVLGYLQGADIRSGNRLWKLLVAGVVALFVPGILLIIYGTKCLLALFIGLALAATVHNPSVDPSLETAHDIESHTDSLQVDAPQNGPSTPYSYLLISLFTVGIGVAMVQWTHHLLPVGLMARADKIRLLTQGTGTLLVLILVAELVPWLRNRGALPVPPGTTPSLADLQSDDERKGDQR